MQPATSQVELEVASMRAGILLFRPSVLFFALALVVFLTMIALNAGESSAKLNCDPSFTLCSGGGALTNSTGGAGRHSTDDSFSGGGGTGNNQEGTFEGFGGHRHTTGGEDTISGGGKIIGADHGFGGRCVGTDCTPNR